MAGCLKSIKRWRSCHKKCLGIWKMSSSEQLLTMVQYPRFVPLFLSFSQTFHMSATVRLIWRGPNLRVRNEGREINITVVMVVDVTASVLYLVVRVEAATLRRCMTLFSDVTNKILDERSFHRERRYVETYHIRTRFTFISTGHQCSWQERRESWDVFAA